MKSCAVSLSQGLGTSSSMVSVALSAVFLCLVGSASSMGQPATAVAPNDADSFFQPGASKGGTQQSVDVEGRKLFVERLVERPEVRMYNGREVGAAIRVWAEVLSGPDRGKLVNLQRYKWAPNQEFRLHVQSAYPLSFAVFQSFPEDRPPTRQVLPTNSLPETFSTIPAGADHALPYKFVTDNDLRNESIQLVFVRADSREAPQGCLRDRQGMRFGDASSEISKGFSEAATNGKLIVAPLDAPNRPVIGATPSDVGIMFMGPGFIHHGQITLIK